MKYFFFIDNLNELKAYRDIKSINKMIRESNNIIKYINSNEKKPKEKEDKNIFDILYYISSLSGMFDDDIEPTKCLRNSNRCCYGTIIIFIIIGLQLFSLIYPCIKRAFSVGQFLLFLFSNYFSWKEHLH